MKIDLHALAAMPEDERADAINDLVDALIAQGIIEDQADALRSILASIGAAMAQRRRPN